MQYAKESWCWGCELSSCLSQNLSLKVQDTVADVVFDKGLAVIGSSEAPGNSDDPRSCSKSSIMKPVFGLTERNRGNRAANGIQ